MTAITIIGATGRVGRRLTAQLLAEGYEVTAFMRSLAKFEEGPPLTALTPERPEERYGSLRLIQGDVRSGGELLQAVQGADAVLSTLSTDGGTVLTEGMPRLLEAMGTAGVRRLIAVSTAGILESRTEPGVLRYLSSESRRSLTRAAAEHHAVFELLKAHGRELDWTLLCPTYLPEGDRTGEYRLERDYLPDGGTQISTGDTADAVCRLIGRDDLIHARVGIAY